MYICEKVQPTRAHPLYFTYGCGAVRVVPRGGKYYKLLQGPPDRVFRSGLRFTTVVRMENKNKNSGGHLDLLVSSL